MFMNQRTQVVYSLLAEYVRSPSLRHMREERSLAKLALEIVTKLDQDSSIWKKWEGPRDKILGVAIECWIPKADMLDFLNILPGPALTMTDLEQRMKSMIEEEYLGDPEPKLEAECLAIYQAEKAAGTEMPAIIERLSDYTSAQFQRLRDERRAEEERRLAYGLDHRAHAPRAHQGRSHARSSASPAAAMASALRANSRATVMIWPRGTPEMASAQAGV